MTRVLFVCLGNICRSPVAEGQFKRLLSEKGLEDKYQVDSCGTGSWHEGEPPHPESQKVSLESGVDISGQKSRPLRDEDFFNFDYLIAMDRSNRNDIEERRIGDEAKVYCLRRFEPGLSRRPEGADLDVPDPFYGGPGGFPKVQKLIESCCEELLAHLEDGKQPLE